MDFFRDTTNLFSCAVLLAGVLCVIKVIVDRLGTSKLPGIVVGSQQDRGAFFPVIEFVYEGQTIRLAGSNGASKPKYTTGQQVEVLYKPSNQKYVSVVGNHRDVITAVVILICGIAMAILCLIKYFG